MADFQEMETISGKFTSSSDSSDSFRTDTSETVPVNLIVRREELVWHKVIWAFLAGIALLITAVGTAFHDRNDSDDKPAATEKSELGNAQS